MGNPPTQNQQNHNQNHQNHNQKLPKRIILLRHGESQGNIDTKAYSLLDTSSFSANSASAWRVYFMSPLMNGLDPLSARSDDHFLSVEFIGVREECRIREQDFGNFQREIGRFFYRFPEGESAADVYDRVSSFMESLWRDIDMSRLHQTPTMSSTS
ncbi:Phosphoglycerate mutase-like protein AT74 [Bienertia sinuspersici]